MSEWIEVKAELSASPLDWSPWDEIFEEHGIAGTVQTDKPPTLSGYLSPDALSNLEPLIQALESAGAINVTHSQVPEVDWSEAWKQFFVPRRIGNHFMVVPSWSEFDPQPGDITITLDPGQAFGTGDHPTTRGCLELLERAGAQGKEVADIGCGSGILAVGAALIGAKSLDCVDTDPLCIRSTTENFARNNVTGNTFLGAGFDPLPSEQTYDLVLSNIISAALIGISHEAARRVRPGGIWIISGIIESNWPDVLAKATACGFTLIDHIHEGDWIAARLTR